MIVTVVLRETAAVVAAAALAAGCGAHTEAPAVQSNREWIANVRGVVDQLRGDIVAVSGFDRVAAARKGLRDESQLYGLLVAYTDFGGCLHMAAAVGVEPPGRARVVQRLHPACVHLPRADPLFTRALARAAPLLPVGATLAA